MRAPQTLRLGHRDGIAYDWRRQDAMVWHCLMRREPRDPSGVGGSGGPRTGLRLDRESPGGGARCRLDLPTPCRSWTVKDVINHVIGSAASYAELAETGVMPTGGADTDHAGGRVQRSVRAGGRSRGRRVQRARRDGEDYGNAVRRDARFGLRVDRCWRHFHHGWDLAKATGQSATSTPNSRRSCWRGSSGSCPAPCAARRGKHRSAEDRGGRLGPRRRPACCRYRQP